MANSNSNANWKYFPWSLKISSTILWQFCVWQLQVEQLNHYIRPLHQRHLWTRFNGYQNVGMLTQNITDILIVDSHSSQSWVKSQTSFRINNVPLKFLRPFQYTCNECLHKYLENWCIERQCCSLVRQVFKHSGKESPPGVNRQPIRRQLLVMWGFRWWVPSLMSFSHEVE